MLRFAAGPATAALVFGLAAPACAHTPCPAEIPMQSRARIDAGLAERIRHAPESEVGVFVRAVRPPTVADRAELARAGLQIGTVTGPILAGRLRACDAVQVSALDFVQSIELATEVTRPPPPPVP
jgi:hypothetical protein